MTQTAVTAPAFTVLDLPGGERNLIGLARVSTDAQDAQLQQDALTFAGCARIYVEKVSTRKATANRPGLVAGLDYLRPGDTLVVWKLDRLGRSVKDVLIIADDLHAPASASDPHRQAVRQLLAHRRGQVLLHHDGCVRRAGTGHHPRADHGRPGRCASPGTQRRTATVMDADKLAAARARRARGESPTEIARALGVSRASVYRHLAAAGE